MTNLEALSIVRKLEARSPTILNEMDATKRAVKQLSLSEEDLMKLISKSKTKNKED